MTGICEWLGISRQAFYQFEKRAQATVKQTQQVLELIMHYRYLMPNIRSCKLYWLSRPKLLEHGVRIVRDKLFKTLKENNLLIKINCLYTKTTHSKHWMKKHPNLLKNFSTK